MAEEGAKTLYWEVDDQKCCLWCVKEMLDTQAMTLLQLAVPQRIMGLCLGHEPCGRCGQPYKRGDFDGEAERLLEKMWVAYHANRGMDESRQRGEHEPGTSTE